MAEGHGLQAMPAATSDVSLYLSDLARQGYKPSTLQRRLTAISQAHKRSNFQFDTGHALIRETLGGIKRTCGTEAGSEGRTLDGGYTGHGQGFA